MKTGRLIGVAVSRLVLLLFGYHQFLGIAWTIVAVKVPETAAIVPANSCATGHIDAPPPL